MLLFSFGVQGGSCIILECWSRRFQGDEFQRHQDFWRVSCNPRRVSDSKGGFAAGLDLKLKKRAGGGCWVLNIY